MELDLIEEEIPKIQREGGSGREPEHWEDHLAAIKSSPNKSFRVWTYGVRTSAVSRMSTVRNRLTDATPEDNWEIKVRPVPDSDNQFGVYIVYRGTFTAEEVKVNEQNRQKRSERTRAARQNSKTNGSAPGAENSDSAPGNDVPTGTPAQTAKEKVAAARASKR